MLAGITAAKLTGQVLNVGCAQATNLNDLANLLVRLLDAKITPVHTDPRGGDVRDSLADISAIRNLLGYEPLVLFDEGLARTVQWFTSAPNRR